MCMVQMKCTELSLTKNQVSTHIWKIILGKQMSPGIVKQCRLYGHEASVEGRLFQDLSLSQVPFFPNPSLPDSLEGSPLSAILTLRLLPQCHFVEDIE